MNPFSTTYNNDKPDSLLVSEILNGNKESLNGLILRHQPFIYNIAWKMEGDPSKAEDLTQEALLKIISNLSSFKNESTFRTWAYRIVRNHFLNDLKKPSQQFASNFEELGMLLDASPSSDLSGDNSGEYNTTFFYEDGKLYGSTHAIERRFLAVWIATREK